MSDNRIQITIDASGDHMATQVAEAMALIESAIPIESRIRMQERGRCMAELEAELQAIPDDNDTQSGLLHAIGLLSLEPYTPTKEVADDD